ncbi:inward rectifier potassium channel 16-like [Chanos chanos]|uniref:Inward rectifier potassium channel 16-like n=1 Tax=Chanos chanos TaxID=29144 RepID=A0A6J2WM04_CHACN|nr:inward rectifier potassium channel 16-like [Chanos chanos]
MSPRGEEPSIVNTYETSAPVVLRQKQRKKQRYIQKDGHCTATLRQSSGKWSHYLQDIFTTLVEIRWRVMFLFFSLSYITSWLFFGLIYWLIAFVNGDSTNPDTELCIANMREFTAAFLFSMETQRTIGYGYRFMTEKCMAAIVVVTIQDLMSCFMNTFIIGVVVAKMSSARKRAQTVGFSNCAVVNLRDGEFCLCWRIGDFRGNHMLEGTTSAQLIRHTQLPSGAVSVTYQDLEIQNKDVTLVTPALIIHKLDSDSPLYSLSPRDLREADFELVVTFTYTDDSRGILHQNRSSYTPDEIRWAQRFQSMLKEGQRHYHVDYALFHQTCWVRTPMVSAEERDRTSVRAEPDKPLMPFSQHLSKRHVNRQVNGKSDTNKDAYREAYREAWL